MKKLAARRLICLVIGHRMEKSCGWASCSRCGHREPLTVPQHRYRTLLTDGCVTTLQCILCGYQSQESAHEYAVVKDARCFKSEVCAHCGHVRNGSFEHEFVVTKTPCGASEKCVRCGAVGRWPKFTHDFEVAAPKDKKDCKVLKRCRKCGETEETYEHQWERTKYEERDAPGLVRAVSVCTHWVCKTCCSEKDESEIRYTD